MHLEKEEGQEKMYKFSEVNFLEIEEKTEYIELIEKEIRQAFLEEKIETINLYINIILTNPGNIRKYKIQKIKN